MKEGILSKNIIRTNKEKLLKTKIAMEWISVNRRKKPKEDQEVLCFAPDHNIIGSILIGKYFKAERGFSESWTVYDFAESKLDANVTHWMPLPKKPK